MCFSAEADFTAAAVIGTIGVVTLSKVEHPREVPIAALPLAFALHSAVEGVVWLSRDGHASPGAGDLAADFYISFAWALLPLLLPLAVMLIEPDRVRRRAMGVFVALGGAVGAYLGAAALTNGVDAQINGHTITYGGAGNLGNLATVLYVIATCAPPLLSSHRGILWFGALNLVAVALLGLAQSDGLTSLWCLWAAGVSVLITLQLIAWRRDGVSPGVRKTELAVPR